eukprot:TRINITY_DN3084_c0_g1_i1.p1 TRINITY_DN3084_c0_g1~~TRINITY_DN3084_c0_g1_i1.p1  ORF type:complete len:676 (+),score=41.27 TRINITY_DN3084_c0_g1_i1:61-2088(+)
MSDDGGSQQAGLIQVASAGTPQGSIPSDWFSISGSASGQSRRSWEDEERQHLLFDDADVPNAEAGRLQNIYWRPNTQKRLDECVVDQLKCIHHRGSNSVPVIVEYGHGLLDVIGHPNSRRYFLVDSRIDVGKLVTILNNILKQRIKTKQPPQTYWSVAQEVPEQFDIEWNAVYSSTKIGDLWHGDAIFGILHPTESKKLFPFFPLLSFGSIKVYHIIVICLLFPMYIVTAIPITVSKQLEALRMQLPTSEIGQSRSRLSWGLAVVYATTQFVFPYVFEFITSTSVEWSVSLHLVMWIPLYVVDIIDNQLFGDPTPPRTTNEVPKLSSISCILSILYPVIRCIQISTSILVSDNLGWDPTFLNPILLNYDDDLAFYIAVGMATFYYIAFGIAAIFLSRQPKTLRTLRMKENCVPFLIVFSQLAFIPIVRTLVLKLCTQQNGELPHSQQVIASAAMLMYLPVASFSHTLLREVQPEQLMLHGARHYSVDKLLVFVLCITEGLTSGKDHGYWTWVIVSQVAILCGIGWLIATRPFISPVGEGVHFSSWGVAFWAYCVSIIARNTSDTNNDQKALMLSGIVAVGMLVILAIRLFPKTFIFPPHPSDAARLTSGIRISWITQGSHLPKVLTLPLNNNTSHNLVGSVEEGRYQGNCSPFGSFSGGARTTSFASRHSLQSDQ